MNFDIVNFIAAFFITAFGAVLSILTQLYDSDKKINKQKRNILLVGFFITLFGAALTLFAGFRAKDNEKTSKRQETAYRNKNLELQEQLRSAQFNIIKLQNTQLDTSLEIINLNKLLYQKQEILSEKNETIINLQKSSLKEITGGNNKPLLFFDLHTTYSDYKKYFVSIYLSNIGNTFLKDVDISFTNGYKGMLEVANDTSFSYSIIKIDSTSNYRPGYYPTNTYIYSIPPDEFSIKTIDTSQTKEIVTYLLPKNAKYIRFDCDITWSRGNYKLYVLAKIVNDDILIKKFDLYMHGSLVHDQMKHLKLEDISIVDFIKCDPINVNGKKFEIYLSKVDNHIMIREKGKYIFSDLKQFKTKGIETLKADITTFLIPLLNEPDGYEKSTGR